MDCPATFEIEEVITGRADEKARAELAEHLSSCARCQRRRRHLDSMLTKAGGGQYPSSAIAAFTSLLFEFNRELERSLA